MLSSAGGRQAWIALSLGLSPAAAAAQDIASAAPGATNRAADSVVVVAGAGYAAGGLHRLLLGSHYRDLWATPVQVEVLNLGTFAGGLRPVKRGGGLQTRSLRFEGADGRQYVFRSVQKDPSRILPPELQGTIAAKIAQDQISSELPAAFLVTAPLLDAAGVLNTDPRLVYLPDDPQLGVYRAEFKNLLGQIEERPDVDDDEMPGFAGAIEIVSTDELFERIERGPADTVDAREFLRARLVDVYVGDWDRHRDQWRWAKVRKQGGPAWLPIPRDRDQAFVRFDGVLPSLARQSYPMLLEFGPRYGKAVGATWNGRDLDRRFLSVLPRSAWDSMAAELAVRLTDATIDSAVAQLPEAYWRSTGADLAGALKARRDQLHQAARAYYHLLAGQVDLHGTGQADSAAVTFVDEQLVSVRIFSEAARAGGGTPYVARTFTSEETSDVRLYMHGGDDRVVFEGEDRTSITVRVIGGGGNDTLQDPARSRKVRFYDDRGTNTAVGHKIDTRHWATPTDPRQVPPRDWGSRVATAAWVGGGPDIGVLLGGSATLFRYGFRKVPYSSRWRFRLGYATEAQTLNGDVLGDIRLVNSATHFTILARGSGITTLNFYGFGNQTPQTEASSYYRVRQVQFTIEPGVSFGLGPRTTLSFTARAVYSVTDDDDNDFIATQSVLGTGGFGQVGATAQFEWLALAPSSLTSSGLSARLGGSVYGPIWSVPSTYGEVHGDIWGSWTFLPWWVRPTLALRIGGERVWGNYPFQDAAYIGGAGSVRSLRNQRYGGDAALFGSAELRLRVARVFSFLPTDLGIMGLADLGRVFLEGESSKEWYPAYGGGVWLGFLGGRSLASITLAGGTGSLRTYFGVGLGF